MMILRPIALFCLIATMVAGIALGIAAFWFTSGFKPEVARDESLLLSVVRQVNGHYVQEVSRSQLVDNAIRGVIAGLDDHSVFLDARDLMELEEETTGRFGGIGVDLSLVDGYIMVTSPLADEPAARAGVEAGDRIIEVDHAPVKGRSLHDVVVALRGDPGTDVHLRVRRPAASEPLDFDLTRDTIEDPGVSSRLLEPGYGYVGVSQFNESTADEVERAVADLVSDGVLDGLVLDLRNNPGGLLDASVAVADAFLADGLIVYIEGRNEDSGRRYKADGEDIAAGVPMAVLVNGGSASASEIVAGALQDRDRATVVGTKSFGKGSVQSVMYFQERRAIKLTTAHYLTPDGHSIQSSGVIPDIAVDIAEGESWEEYNERLLAAALAYLKQEAAAS